MPASDYLNLTLNYFGGLKPGKAFHESFDQADVTAADDVANTVDVNVRNDNGASPPTPVAGVAFCGTMPTPTTPSTTPYAGPYLPTAPVTAPPPPKRR